MQMGRPKTTGEPSQATFLWWTEGLYPGLLRSSKKQELVTLSTTEAEYVAATHAAKKAIWLRHLLTELFGSIDAPTVLFSNSKLAICLAHDSHFHARTKHIDIQYHFIRYIIEVGTIKLVYCPTDDMTADALTKALPSVKAKHFASALGLSTGTV